MDTIEVTDPKLGAVYTQVKGIVEHIGDTSVAAVKARLAEGLDGRPLTWLADQTGEDYKNIQRWISGTTAPPVWFIAPYCRATGLSERWVLTGELPKWAGRPHEAETAMSEIASIVERYRQGDVPVVPGYRPLPPDDEEADSGRRAG